MLGLLLPLLMIGTESLVGKGNGVMIGHNLSADIETGTKLVKDTLEINNALADRARAQTTYDADSNTFYTGSIGEEGDLGVNTIAYNKNQQTKRQLEDIAAHYGIRGLELGALVAPVAAVTGWLASKSGSPLLMGASILATVGTQTVTGLAGASAAARIARAARTENGANRGGTLTSSVLAAATDQDIGLERLRYAPLSELTNLLPDAKKLNLMKLAAQADTHAEILNKSGWGIFAKAPELARNVLTSLANA